MTVRKTISSHRQPIGILVIDVVEVEVELV
jgi:hypothetical protein